MLSLCIIITPWGRYKYVILQMGIMTAPDIFQNKMSDLMSKSFFRQEQVEYLVYLLTREGINALPRKVKAILDMKPPTNIRGNAGNWVLSSITTTYGQKEVTSWLH